MYSKELESIKKSNRFRTRELFDDNLIDLASNDYLGLSTNKTLFQNTYETLLKDNYHSPKASMLVNGYSKIHKKFEDRLCEVNDFEAGVIVGSGFLANISMIEALCRKNDTLFIDEEYHASGILATKLLKPEQVIVFNHNDFKDLEKKISANQRTGRNIIAIEGVYSMGGDLAPIEIFQIADEKKAILIVDEAHSFGVIGDNLLGIFDYYKIKPTPYHVKMGTLGKAYGSYGAYILASKQIIEFLTNRAKPIIYSTAPSLFDTALANESLDYIIENKDLLKEKNPTTNFAHEFFGLNVIENNSNKIIGKVSELINFPANDVLQIDCGDKYLNLPYVDEFIKSIDLDNKVIKVVLPNSYEDLMESKWVSWLE